MIDSGATAMFIDQEFCNVHHLPLQKKVKPQSVYVVDGEPIRSGPITHECQIPVSIGKHHETVTFQVTTLGQHPMILGLPWLKKHNPEIEWSTHQVMFKSQYCQEQCLEESPIVKAPREESAIQQFVRTMPVTPHQEQRKLQLSSITASKSASLAAEVARANKPPTDPRTIVPREYHDLLQLFPVKEATEPPPRRGIDHRIELLPNETPPFKALYNLSGNELRTLRDYLEKNLRKGWIRASSSSAEAPVLFALKKDGSLRLCVDYRGLNAITKKDRYPLPLVSEALDRLNQAKFYTKLDIRDAYHSIRIAEGDEWKTAFRTKYGLFEYLVMPFGLTNAPATFQRWINDILREYLDTACLVYLDDILIFSESLEQHRQDVRNIITKLGEHQIQFKAGKCEFHTTEIEYLGFIVNPGGIKMDPVKVEAISSWKPPKSVRETQVFIGFVNFYRRFIEGFSRIARPLFKKLTKDTKFQWSEKDEQAFEILKSKFTAAPILAHYNPERPCLVETDASDFVTSGILSQPDDNQIMHPIAFISAKMTPAECNYSIEDKELLAIVKAFKTWRAYLEGNPHRIEVLTDHGNLLTLTTTKELNRRQVRWSEKLASFNFIIKFKPGKQHGKPDALTRRPYDLPEERDIRRTQNTRRLLQPTNFMIQATTLIDEPNLSQQIRHTTPTDKQMTTVMRQLKDGVKQNKEVALGRCKIQDGLLLYDYKVWVPDDTKLRLSILKQHHDSTSAGHTGSGKTLDILKRTYYWPRMRDFVKRYVRNCDVCSRIKTTRHAPYGLLKPLEAPQQPWQSLSMDFIVKLPISNGYDSIWVIIDRLTKMAHFIPCNENITAGSLAKLYHQQIFRLHGLPADIVSDRDKLFTSELWKGIAKQAGINRSLSTAYHPQSDGQTERTNSILEQYLRAYCNYLQDNWADLIPSAEFCYNNSKSETTGVTPFFANLGYHPSHEFDSPRASTGISEEVQSKAKRLREIHEKCHEEINWAQERQAEQANKRRSPDPALQVGDEVWLLRKHIHTTRPSDKLDFKKLGKFKISSKVGANTYKLQLPPSMKIHPVFHVSLLEPASTDPLPGHLQPPPPPTIVNDITEYEVESILDSRYHYGKLQYRAKWKGYTADQDQEWYPAEFFENSQELIKDYHQTYPKKPKQQNAPTRRSKRKQQ